jgi:hypothetical protein|tara:strand:- start:1752 stop:2174 length:423 start_codon:yes stop_codon:yes gene_type:complete
MDTQTDIVLVKEDLGKNLYRKKTYYTLVIEQEVLANTKDEADKKLSDNGIDHSQINHEITETKDGVETYMVDANYTDSDTTEYLGKVSYTDDEYAEENGDVEIDQYADEVKNDDEFDKWATNQSNLEDSIQLEIDSESEK